MTTSWTLGVLSSGMENVVALDAGVEASGCAAFSAASAALLAVIAASGREGRQEYRLCVAGTLMIVTPGLTAVGTPDVDDLRQSLEAWPAPV